MSLLDDCSRGTAVNGHGVKSDVLVMVTIVMEHHEQKQLEEEQVCYVHICTYLFITKGGQGWNSSRILAQELMQKSWRNASHLDIHD